MPPQKKKKKQRKKSKQQRKKGKNKQKTQNRHQKKKTGNEHKTLSHKDLIKLLKKGCNELNSQAVSNITKQRKHSRLSQNILRECFDIIWKKCGNKTQCTEHILAKKLLLLETLITNFKLDLNSSHNFLSAKNTDTVYHRMCLLCNKCLLPMIDTVYQRSAPHDMTKTNHNEPLKQLILQQLHYSLFAYIDKVAIKFETNSLGIINMSWDSIIEPTLHKWWSSPNNTQCKAIIPWSISHGVYLDVVFPYFSVFRDYITNTDEILNIDGIDDKQVFNPLKISISDSGCIDELNNIPTLVYKQLMITIGKSLLRRKRSAEDTAITSIDRIYDRDLEYIYMHIADLFDEGRLRWLRTDRGVQVYQSYVSIVNDCIDHKCPLIGKIVTYFLIGNAGMIIV